MSSLPDEYYTASLQNSLPTVTFPSRPYHRTVTAIVVTNGVSSSVNVYRGQLGSQPVATNLLGNNNTINGKIPLPAGQQLFVVWSAAGSPVSSAYARLSAERVDNPLDDATSTEISWSTVPVTSLTLPTGAVSGFRIFLDGSNGIIEVFDNSNRLTALINPFPFQNKAPGFSTSVDLTNAAIPWATLQGGELDLSPGQLGSVPFTQTGRSARFSVFGIGTTGTAVAGGLEIDSPIGDTQSGTDQASLQLISRSADGVSSPVSIVRFLADDVSSSAIFFGGKGSIFTNAVPESSALSWQTATLINGWSGTLKYRILASPPNCIQLQSGTMTAGTKADGTAIAVLPAGYRPSTSMDFPATCDNQAGGQSPHWNVDTSGNVKCFGISLSSFAGLSIAAMPKDFP